MKEKVIILLLILNSLKIIIVDDVQARWRTLPVRRWFVGIGRLADQEKEFWDRYKPFHVRPSNAEIRIEVPKPGQIIKGGIVAKCSFWYFEDVIDRARFIAGRALALHPYYFYY
jgi:hypothetical protein